MQVGHLYELLFPYEEKQGGSRRPVFILAVNTEQHNALGLKITHSGPTYNHPYRYRVQDWSHANLDEGSHIQYDRYKRYDNQTLRSRGVLSERDYREIARLFTRYHLL
ncbi:hypothetical protein [Salimicrobium halophilum]|uniref:PemK-like, MazF-like toxin of type II toxin-antitoxin system n=1 Tax=Salimicrobium halophilum TaxID=86666 RepID=A0A1G8W8X6_9BACI|nr:hypothetical protein [Salimicrobium halophilum]SDJ74175.1 hypothetical protein SAMN04490247_3067 [Salimicrobium halophilum]